MDCPRCERELREGATSCPCGWRSRTKAVSGTVKTDYFCQWKTHGKRCYMFGDLSPDIGDGRRNYCHWHYVCLHRPEFAHNFEEFSAWNQQWKRYCSIENHHPESEVFDSICGIRPITSAPTWCGLIDCKHFSILDTAKWVKEGKGLEVGTYWNARQKVEPTRRRYREVTAEEQTLWTPKTILARQRIGLPTPETGDIPF